MTGSLFPDIDQETDEAVQRSFDNSNQSWREITLNNLMKFCEYTDTFTMNDFRDYNALYCKATTHDNRAMGGVIRTARTYGWIIPTGRTIISRVGHKSPLQIWKSIIKKK